MNHTKRELERLVAVTLDRTGIDPTRTRIDCVVPDSILDEYDPKDVVEVALDKGFVAELCTLCPSLKVNGKWVPVEADLLKKASSKGRSKFHSTCNSCYSQYKGLTYDFY